MILFPSSKISYDFIIKFYSFMELDYITYKKNIKKNILIKLNNKYN